MYLSDCNFQTLAFPAALRMTMPASKDVFLMFQSHLREAVRRNWHYQVAYNRSVTQALLPAELPV